MGGMAVIEGKKYGDSAPNNKLFVANLTYNTRQRDLEDIFSKYGKVAEVHIAEDRDTGRSKGFAFVTMEDARDAKDALAAAGKVVDDREIKVELAVGKSRGGGGGGRYGDGGGGGGRFSNPGICYDWKSGRCSRGSSCRFSHEGEDRGGVGAEEGEEGIETTVETTIETAEEIEIGTELPAGTTGTETTLTGTVTEEIAAETNPGTDRSENGIMKGESTLLLICDERENRESTLNVACLCCFCSFILPVFLSCCYRASYVKCPDRRFCICPVLLSLFASMPTTFPPYFMVVRRPHCLLTKPSPVRACVSV
eukprot:gene34212-44197_t